MGGGNGFEVNAETVISCGKQIGDLSEKAKKLKEDCASAEVPDIAWGLLGAATTFSSYQQMLQKLQTHLDQIGEGVRSAGEKITQCGEGYQDADTNVADKMQKILSDVSGMKV